MIYLHSIAENWYSFEHMTGQFIVLEGPDGSGTTTHVKLLADTLKSAGKDVVLTCEPSDSAIGTFIRSELAKKTISPAALQILFTADRAQHVHDVIEPALKAGKTVICDRYWLSTVVYAEALGIKPEPLAHINKTFVQPDIQLVLLPSLEICLERIGQRPTRDMLETDSLQKRVYEGYRIHALEQQLHIIDTSGSIEDAAKDIQTLAGF